MALRLDDVDLTRDRALVERFQAGDAAAFDALYLRYFGRLTRYCQKRVGDRNDAEEIAQEAFARALRAMPRFAGDRRFYPWVTVIASRLCVDHHRRRGRSTLTAEVDLGIVEPNQDAVLEAEDIALLGRAMERLAPRHREVLELRESRGWSYQAIADHYDVTIGTVEALLFRARKALKREFLAVGGEERGRLVALPVVGWLVRRGLTWKARLEAIASPLGGLATPAVVAVAVAVGGTAAVVATAPDSNGSVPVRRTEVVRSLPASVVSSPAGAAAADASRGAPAAATGPSSPASLMPSPPDSSNGGRVDLPADDTFVGGAEDAHRTGSEDATITKQVSDVSVYLAPERAVADAAGAARGYLEGVNQ